MRIVRKAMTVGAVLAVALLGAPPVSAGQAAQSLIVSANPADNTPNVLDAKVEALVQIGSTMYVGGTFKQEANVGGPTLDQAELFSFDVTTGLIDESFDPFVRGHVFALATDGTDLFVGGTFSKVSGVPSNLIVKLDPAGHVVSAFTAQITGTAVNDLSYANGLLYVGGAFTKVNGIARSNFAALDPTDGSVITSINVPFTGLHNGGIGRISKFDISPDGTKLVAVGNFTTVDGLSREQIAVLDITSTSATVDGWVTYRYLSTCNPVFDSTIHDVDISPDGSYFVIGTTGSFVGGVDGGTLCDTVTRWELNRTGTQQPSWIDYLGGDTTWSVATTGTAVYIGGHMRWVNNPYVGNAIGPGTIKRQGMAGLDPSNGMPFSWNPGRKKGQGVFSIIGTADGVWYGSDTDEIGHEYHARLAFFPLDGGSAVPVHTPATLPGELYSLPASGASLHLIHRSFDGATAGPTSTIATPQMDWANARGSFLTLGRVYYGLSDGTMGYRTFDGTTVGNKQFAVYLHGLSPDYFPVANITGMFYDNGRIYYTVSGSPNLYYRYFTPEDNEVGAVQLVASPGADGFDWGSVQGMTFAQGKVYVARSDGDLYSIDWTSGDAHGSPVPASQVLIDSDPGQAWASNGMFVWNS